MYYEQHPSYGRPVVAAAAYSVETRVAHTRRPEANGVTRLKQAVFFVLVFCCLIGTIYGIVHVLGFDSMAQLQGADRLVDAMDLEPPPRF